MLINYCTNFDTINVTVKLALSFVLPHLFSFCYRYGIIWRIMLKSNHIHVLGFFLGVVIVYQVKILNYTESYSLY